MQNKQIEKLKQQVARYEAKGYKNTAAHIMLERLQSKKHPVAGVSSGTPKKVKQEAQDGE